MYLRAMKKHVSVFSNVLNELVYLPSIPSFFCGGVEYQKLCKEFYEWEFPK